MKFSVLRKEERKRCKKLASLIKMLSELNPSATFEYSCGDISTNLSGDALGNVQLPEGVDFLGDEGESCHYGFVRISYDSEKYTIKNDCIF